MLCVRPVLPDGVTVVPIGYQQGELDEAHIKVVLGINGHETEEVSGLQFKDGYICIPISHTMPLGVYDVHITGLMNGEDQETDREVSDNRKAMFELVKYGNGITYDRYYTDMVIIGLPDSYIEKLRHEMEQKIAEAEAAKEAWMSKAQALDGLAKQGDNQEATNTAIYNLVMQGGGGGGGAIPPIQFDALAKEVTARKILDAVSLKAKQADEDWQNVKPITE